MPDKDINLLPAKARQAEAKERKQVGKIKKKRKRTEKLVVPEEREQGLWQRVRAMLGLGK